jgi:hypothetical protein
VSDPKDRGVTFEPRGSPSPQDFDHRVLVSALSSQRPNPWFRPVCDVVLVAYGGQINPPKEALLPTRRTARSWLFYELTRLKSGPTVVYVSPRPTSSGVLVLLGLFMMSRGELGEAECKRHSN